MTERLISRRQALGSALALAGGALVGAGTDGARGEDAPRSFRVRMPSISADSATGGAGFGRESIEHIVLVTMENRSFDHLLGWLPGADGIPAGITFPDRNGKRVAPARWTDFHGCGFSDPNHQFDGARVEYNNGACDGWLLASGNDVFSTSYYTEADLPFMGPAARNWTVMDRYFCAIMGPTIPNRFFLHTGQTDRMDSSTRLTSLHTIWDRLIEKGLSGRYYLGGIGGPLGVLDNILTFWGTKYLGISADLRAFVASCASGNLANVSYVDPNFDLNSDHPHQDIRDGETFLNTVYNAVTTSPAWPKTVLIITFDEWGGFFDHVRPTEAPISPITKAAGAIDGLRGFRVPTLIISPFARRNFVSHTLFDHASVLRMIEWRWDLEPLTERDATANNLADALDFSRRDLAAPRFDVPPRAEREPVPVVAAPAHT